jgi:succinyl-CoA synthetase beta subunit
MASFGVRVQRGDVANSPDRAVQVAQHVRKEAGCSPVSLSLSLARSLSRAHANCGGETQLLKESPDAELVIKAQIHAGGRGKGHFDNGFKGGVQVGLRRVSPTCSFSPSRD